MNQRGHCISQAQYNLAVEFRKEAATLALDIARASKPAPAEPEGGRGRGEGHTSSPSRGVAWFAVSHTRSEYEYKLVERASKVLRAAAGQGHAKAAAALEND